jgi:hypothetical protein
LAPAEQASLEYFKVPMAVIPQHLVPQPLEVAVVEPGTELQVAVVVLAEEEEPGVLVEVAEQVLAAKEIMAAPQQVMDQQPRRRVVVAAAPVE